MDSSTLIRSSADGNETVYYAFVALKKTIASPVSIYVWYAV